MDISVLTDSVVPTKTLSIYTSDQIKELVAQLRDVLLSSVSKYSAIINSISMYILGDIRTYKNHTKDMINNGFGEMLLTKCEVYSIHMGIVKAKDPSYVTSIISDMIYNWYIYEETLIADLRSVSDDYLARYFKKYTDVATQKEYLTKRIANYQNYINFTLKRLEMI